MFTWLIPAVLYAEVHYRFPFFFSLLFKKEPEILFDAPNRIDPGREIPVLLLIKDAHRFPLNLVSVHIVIRETSGKTRTVHFDHINKRIEEGIFFRIFRITPQETGWVEIHPQAVLETEKGHRITIGVDNYRFSSKDALQVYVSQTPLPSEPGWFYGDLHTHSIYSSDHVEYGAPLAAAAELAKCSGLSWFASTDHSYDLDDHLDDYTKSDPDLPLWNRLCNDARELNGQFTVFPGEEVSCGTAHGRNAHLLAIGHDSFFEGWGDGAERWFKTRPQLSIPEVLSRLKSEDGIGIAAHPLESIPLLQWLLLKRGTWTRPDLSLAGLTGLQFHNGKRDRGFRKGRRYWIKLLLEGKKIFAFGGSDAHGNFNRLRQIGFPFLSIRESYDQTFGWVRTCVKARENRADLILQALQRGECFVTEGPFLNLYITAEDGNASPGGFIRGKNLVLRLTTLSSEEIGSLRWIKLFRGTPGAKSEIEERLNPDDSYEARFNRPLAGNGYVRAEVETETGKLALSNPIWYESL